MFSAAREKLARITNVMTQKRPSGFDFGDAPIKIAVVANCQGTPVANLLQILCDQIEIVNITIVHKARDEESDADLAAYADADIILAQLVNDKYPCRYVQTERLKAEFGGKVISWPNLFYAGYNPEMLYIRDAERRPANGPIGDYHLRPVIDAFKAGKTQETALEWLVDPDRNREKFAGQARASFEELERRENNADIQITDYMGDRLAAAKQFHTFNHPSLELLAVLTSRMAQLIGRDIVRYPSDGMVPEPLGRFMAPTNPIAIEEINAPQSKAPLTVRGLNAEWEAGRFDILPGLKLYSLPEAIDGYYRRYELMGAAMDAVET